MVITRRRLLRGVGAFAVATAAGALPVRAGEEPEFFVGLCGPVFRQGMAHLVDTDWFELCVRHSDWHFDDCSFEGRALIRHCMTGLTYLISPDRAGPVAVRQISSECCACDEDLDPDYVVGHAARHVAAHVTRIIAARRARHDGAIYFRYPQVADPQEVLDPMTEDAPPIAITPLSDSALSATWSDGDNDLFPSEQAVPTTRGEKIELPGSSVAR